MRPRGWCVLAAVAASCMAAQQAGRTPADPSTGAIEGTVLDAATGEPIRKAEVRLNGSLPQKSAAADSAIDMRAGTDASGHFAFRALPAGQYWLFAHRQGYGVPQDARPAAMLMPGEQKSGIEIRLPPLGSISGHVVDEYGAPVACSVSASRSESAGGRRTLVGGGGGQTNDQGEYWIQGLERGGYYVSVRCNETIEAPHPLMKVNDPRKPYLVYASQFYPGVADGADAGRISVRPGVETQGVDFQVRRTSAVTLRGRVDAADPSILASGNVQVQLLPPSLDVLGGRGFGASFDRHNGEFSIRAVTPGSYVLVASTFNGPLYLAEVPLQVGAVPPDPMRLMLSRAPDLSGRVDVEGDNPPPLEQLHVSLEPLSSAFPMRQPQAQVSKDGSFRLSDVPPGKWRLRVMGAAYVKALTIAEKDVSPFGFDLAPGVSGPIRILASNKTGQVQVNLSAASASGGAISLLLVPVDPDRIEASRTQMGAGAVGPVTMSGVVPGRYRLFAIDSPKAWALQQQPEILKTLEGHSQTVEVGEGETVQVSGELIGAEELQEAFDQAQ